MFNTLYTTLFLLLIVFRVGLANSQAQVGTDSQLLKPYTSVSITHDESVSMPRSNQEYLAVFYVNVNGEVISRPAVPIDENDKIVVRVVGTRDRLLALKVERKSAFRDATSIRLVGEPEGTRGLVQRDTSPLAIKEVVLSDFAPGKGEVQISAIDQTDTFKGGDFDFQVNPLYRASLSFGPVYSWLADRSYGIASNGQQDVITVKDRISPRIHYLITYTHFIWGKRDIEKNKTLHPYEHLNPMFGLTLNDVLNNGFFGISLDGLNNSIYIQGGAHFSHVTTLDPASGLSLGSPFSLGADKIPTAKEWRQDWFLGATIDLRAAIKLFSAAATGVGTIK